MRNESEDKDTALQKLENNLRSFIEERLREERIFREEFSHGLKRELLEQISTLLSQRLAPVPYDSKGVAFMRTPDGQRVLLDLAEPFMSMHMIENGVWEPHVREVMRRLLPPGSVFIDVGANIGLHTIYAAHLVGPKGKVIAAEPHPRLIALLNQNIEINGLTDQVTVLEKAVSSKDGENVSFEYFPEHPGMSGFRLDPDRTTRFKAKAETINVTTTSLDAMLYPSIVPNLVKIDVEGFELLVMQGAINILANYVDTAFLLEWEKPVTDSVMGHDALAQLARLFQESGYEPFCCRELGKPKQIAFEKLSTVESEDILFIKPASRLYGNVTAP